MPIPHPCQRRAPRAALWAALLFASSLPARDIHVALSGSDAASGAAATPYATLAKAASSSAPGDTIRIHAGTYTLLEQLEPPSGASESARIVWIAAPGEDVLIDGGAGYIATFAGRSYISFHGLRFTTSDIAVGAGMFYFENSRHIDFERCEFFGMPAEVGAENTAVIRCMSTGWPDSANVQNSDSCTFRDNFFHDNAAPAFRLYDTKGWTIENNTFVNCRHAVGGKDEPYDLMVRRNLVIGGDLAFYFAMQGGGNGVTITENIVVGANSGINIGGLGTYGNKRRNVRVVNNTFHNVRTWLHGWSDTEFDSSLIFRNNIVEADSAANIGAGEDVGARFLSMNKYQSTPMDPARYSFDHNDYQMPDADRSAWFIDGGKSFNGLAAWTAARPAFDQHSLSVDPLFVAVHDTDFHLSSSSPCKGKGRDGEDLGAYPRGDDGTVVGRRLGPSLGVRRLPTHPSSGRSGQEIPVQVDGRRQNLSPPSSGIRLHPGQRSEAILSR